ncbi:MAG: hypothetical protein ACFFBD_07765 [Candidatus Hodarchaeota archaeon]
MGDELDIKFLKGLLWELKDQFNLIPEFLMNYREAIERTTKTIENAEKDADVSGRVRDMIFELIEQFNELPALMSNFAASLRLAEEMIRNKSKK